jgi:c-di-GMP phosphodiesterase
VFKTLLGWFRREQSAEAIDPILHFEALNRQAPLRHETCSGSKPPPGGDTFLCREAVLGRDQRIAGYHFLLKEGARNRIRVGSRTVHHVYAEVLVRNLCLSNIGRLLGHRLAFLEIPDSFLNHPCLDGLKGTNAVLVLQSLPDNGAPGLDELRESIRTLRSRGIRFGIPDPHVVSEFASLITEVDFVVLRATALDARRCLALAERIGKEIPGLRILIRDLHSMEDFGFALKLGTSLFQGPFVTSREEWRDHHLGPDTIRLTRILARLRHDAATAEIVELTKHDPALSLRLLRYINSAANALSRPVSSIDHAVQLMGRQQLYRWLMILLCSTHGAGGRSSAAMESALVRARLMELLGSDRSPSDREALFLTGLLSLIDVILEVPFDAALTPLSIAPEIEAAVLHREGPYAALLELACACENADGEHLRATAAACDILPELASNRHIDALGWALEINS